MPYKAIDLRKVKTYPLDKRKNLVTLKDMIPLDQISPPFESGALEYIVTSIKQARQNHKPVIWMMGAHVIKGGLGLIIADLIQRNIITHIAGNGAVAIHDFELALIGETSEDVATSIEDGTFGMAHETGALIHQALRAGALMRLGFGESLGRFISVHEFPHREASVLYHAYRLQIPFTIHVTLGADIIHQHPDCDFGVLGAASGQDFKIFCHSVSALESGVFLNFGSAVTGPEVFLKALSVARNLGHKVEGFTTANFDLRPLPGDYTKPFGTDQPEYYYRPLKNIINRPTSLSGQGFHIQGDHRLTIPALYQRIIENPSTDLKVISPSEHENETIERPGPLDRIADRCKHAAHVVEDLTIRRPDLKPAIPALSQAYQTIAQSLERGGHLYLAGNGGSMADAQHIVGELQKSFSKHRPLDIAIHNNLNLHDPEKLLSENLEGGLPAIALGLNPVLNSAIDNDFSARWMNIAQELQVLAKPGDVFLGISTSGKAKNIQFASYTARAMGCFVILLTGQRESALAEFADIVIHAPGGTTAAIQEAHVALYHVLCEMLEHDFFPDVNQR